MKQKAVPVKQPAEDVIRDIRRATRRHFSAEEKIRIVLDGLRGEESIATLCQKEGLAPNLYYRWSKECLEAGKKRLVGDTSREANGASIMMAGSLTRNASADATEAQTHARLDPVSR